LQPYHKTQGIVLKTRKYSESSKLLTIYTRELGRINALAKGARKIKSRFGSSLEVFTESKFLFYKQPSAGLYVVSQSQILAPHKALYSFQDKFAAASVMADFLYTHTIQAEAHEELYRFFRASLKELELTEAPQNVLLSFMLKFLTVAGYGLQLKTCSSCGSGAAESGRDCRLSAKHGGVLCEACSRKEGDSVVIGAAALKALSFLQEKGYKVTANLKLDDTSSDEIKKVINNFLKYNYDYELKSLRVMEEIVK